MEANETTVITAGQKACMTVSIIVILVVMLVHALVEGGECTMARQLLDPLIRADYEATVASGRVPEEEWICGTFPSGGNKVFDPITMECVNCHDGTQASAVDYKFLKTELMGTASLVTLQASHPIGMDYRVYNCTLGFNQGVGLPAEMVLMNGQVGCASCHNLLGTNRLYLAVDMESSNLCFTCHRK